MVKEKRATASAGKVDPQRSTSAGTRTSLVPIEPPTKTHEQQVEELLYSSLGFTPASTRELCELVYAGNDEASLALIRKELSLSIPALKSAPFDPTQHEPTYPDFACEDQVSRDTIFAHYFLDAVKFANSHLFNTHQIAIWATTFLASHLSYIDKLQKELDPGTSNATRVVECFRIFRENLYRHVYVEATTPPFIQHQVKSMVDYFFDNYITHINLISSVFGTRQTRVVFAKTYPLIKPVTSTPLQDGILEEKWEDHLLALKEAEEARIANKILLDAVELEAKIAEELAKDDSELPPELAQCTFQTCLSSSRLKHFAACSFPRGFL
jgi:hypothetical protein